MDFKYNNISGDDYEEMDALILLDITPRLHPASKVIVNKLIITFFIIITTYIIILKIH